MYHQSAHSKRGKRVNIRISGKVMLELGWLQHNVKVLCLLRTPTADR